MPSVGNATQKIPTTRILQCSFFATKVVKANAIIPCSSLSAGFFYCLIVSMCPPCPLPGKAFRFWLHHPRLFASSVRDGGGRRGGHRLHHLNVCLVQSMIAGPIQKMDDESFQNDQAEAQSKQLSWCVFSTLKNTFHSLSMNCQNVIAGDGHNRGAITPYKWNLLVKLLFYPHSMFFPLLLIILSKSPPLFASPFKNFWFDVLVAVPHLQVSVVPGRFL